MKPGSVTYLRILLTSRCNMACRFCHREGVPCLGTDLNISVLLDAVEKMHALGFAKFKLMGGEPMLYPDLPEVVRALRSRIGNSDLSMISNGTADASRYEELLSAGMDRINISIHGWTPAFFSLNTGCQSAICDKIRNTVATLSEKRLIGKLNYVVQRDANESDFFELLDFAGGKGLVVDALNLLDSEGFVRSAVKRYSMEEIERLIRSRYIVREVLEVQNRNSLPSRMLKLTNGASVNLKVSELHAECVFDGCAKCKARASCVEGIKAIRLTPDGIVQPCLVRSDNVHDFKRGGSVDEIAAYLKAL